MLVGAPVVLVGASVVLVGASVVVVGAPVVVDAGVVVGAVAVVAVTVVVEIPVVVGAAVVVVAAVSELPPQADTANRTAMNTPTRLMKPSLFPRGGGGDIGALGADEYRRQLTAIGTGVLKIAIRAPSPLQDQSPPYDWVQFQYSEPKSDLSTMATSSVSGTTQNRR